ncbi:glycosyltransferase family 2 protein [Bacteroidales bacterium SW299]|nr:glycosyltransferase family 2 protein [Bacteroidales bacterium SW299]
MSVPYISVIVPVYNVKLLLPRCIDSLLNQKFTDYELLLIDDGSTDGSGEICDEYGEKDSRIKVIHKQNEGVSKTRNRGIDEAQGEWITFVDSDDYVTPDYLSDLYDCTKEGIGLVVTHSKHIKENGELLYNDYNLPQGKIIYDASRFGKMLKEQFISMRGYVHSKMLRKDLIKASEVRFNPEIKFCEDWIFLFSYLNAMNEMVCCSSASNYFYVDREGSLSHAAHDFSYNYTTFGIIKRVALEFCSKYNADIADLGPTYLMHKALTLVTSKSQLRSIKAEDWDFFNRYYPVTSMKTKCDKWIVQHFYSNLSVLFGYFYLARKFRKILERHNLWSIVNVLRK